MSREVCGHLSIGSERHIVNKYAKTSYSEIVHLVKFLHYLFNTGVHCALAVKAHSTMKSGVYSPNKVYVTLFCFGCYSNKIRLSEKPQFTFAIAKSSGVIFVPRTGMIGVCFRTINKCVEFVVFEELQQRYYLLNGVGFPVKSLYQTSVLSIGVILYGYRI